MIAYLGIFLIILTSVLNIDQAEAVTVFQQNISVSISLSEIDLLLGFPTSPLPLKAQKSDLEVHKDRSYYGGGNDPNHVGGFLFNDSSSYEPLIWLFIKDILGAKSILDVGCGQVRVRVGIKIRVRDIVRLKVRIRVSVQVEVRVRLFIKGILGEKFILDVGCGQVRVRVRVSARVMLRVRGLGVVYLLRIS
jgi:hypothetical protein